MEILDLKLDVVIDKTSSPLRLRRGWVRFCLYSGELGYGDMVIVVLLLAAKLSGGVIMEYGRKSGL